MPRTKQRSRRCAKHRPPSRSSLLSLNLSPTQATATTSVGTTTDSTSATTSSVPASTAGERKLCKSPHTPTLYSSSSSSSKSENESEYEAGGARVLEDWKWPGYRQRWRQFAASVAQGRFPLKKICQREKDYVLNRICFVLAVKQEQKFPLLKDSITGSEPVGSFSKQVHWR